MGAIVRKMNLSLQKQNEVKLEKFLKKLKKNEFKFSKHKR
jgi:hypothetical protein